MERETLKLKEAFKTHLRKGEWEKAQVFFARLKDLYIESVTLGEFDKDELLETINEFCLLGATDLAGELLRALIPFEKSGRIEGQDLQVSLAKVYLLLNELEQAQEVLFALPKQDEMEVYLLEAQIYLSLGWHECAEEKVKRAQALDPTAFVPQFMQAQIYFAEDPKKAQSILRRLLKQMDEQAGSKGDMAIEQTEARVLLGMASVCAQDYEEGIQILEKVGVSNLPNEAIGALARAYASLGELERAQQLLKELYENGDMSEEQLYEYGLLCLQLHDPASAERVYRELILQNPFHLDAQYFLALTLRDRGDEYGLLEARKLLEGILQQDPMDWESKRLLADVLYFTDDISGALREMKALEEKFSLNAEDEYFLAHIYWELEEDRLAHKSFQNAPPVLAEDVSFAVSYLAFHHEIGDRASLLAFFMKYPNYRNMPETAEYYENLREDD